MASPPNCAIAVSTAVKRSDLPLRVIAASMVGSRNSIGSVVYRNSLDDLSQAPYRKILSLFGRFGQSHCLSFGCQGVGQGGAVEHRAAGVGHAREHPPDLAAL